MREMDDARKAGTGSEFMKKYLEPELLVIDNWLLYTLTADGMMYLFGFLYKRKGHGTMIISSPLDKSAWLERLGGEAGLMAKEIINLVTENTYEINIKSTTPKKPISMRTIYAEK